MDQYSVSLMKKLKSMPEAIVLQKLKSQLLGAIGTSGSHIGYSYKCALAEFKSVFCLFFFCNLFL